MKGVYEGHGVKGVKEVKRVKVSRSTCKALEILNSLDFFLNFFIFALK